MGVQTPPRPDHVRTTPPLVRVGAVLAIAGLLGIAWWGLRASFDAATGAVGDRAVCAMVGVPDPVAEPEVWACLVERDGAPRVLYTGSHMAVMDLDVRGGELHQADLRAWWLYPSAGILVAGLALMVAGYRGALEEAEGRPAR